MLIWLGVVGTVVCLVLIGILFQLYMASAMVGDYITAIVTASDRMEKACHETLQAVDNTSAMFGKKLRDENDRAAGEFSRVIKEGIAQYSTRTDLMVSDWRQTFDSFSKSEKELAENLGLLLREIKVSKLLANGAVSVVEQNVLAIDKLWQLYETIRGGPRSAAKIAPTDADAASHEAGLDDAQQAAMEAQLVNASARMRARGDDFFEG